MTSNMMSGSAMFGNRRRRILRPEFKRKEQTMANDLVESPEINTKWKHEILTQIYEVHLQIRSKPKHQFTEIRSAFEDLKTEIQELTDNLCDHGEEDVIRQTGVRTKCNEVGKSRKNRRISRKNDLYAAIDNVMSQNVKLNGLLVSCMSDLKAIGDQVLSLGNEQGLHVERNPDECVDESDVKKMLDMLQAKNNELSERFDGLNKAIQAAHGEKNEENKLPLQIKLIEAKKLLTKEGNNSVQEGQKFNSKLSIVKQAITTINELHAHKRELSDQLDSLDKAIKASNGETNEGNKKKLRIKDNITMKESKPSTSSIVLQAICAINELKAYKRFSNDIPGEKLSGGNSSTTLPDPNRPTKLAEKYGELYYNEWKEAIRCTDVKRLFPESQKPEIEEIIIRHLHKILSTCYDECLQLCKEHYMAMIQIMQVDSEQGETNISSLPGCVEVASIRKQNSNKFANYLLTHKILHKKITTSPWDYHNKNAYLIHHLLETKFFEKCVHLCWLMVLQEPAMHLSENLLPATVYDKNEYEEYVQSGDKVAYVVWPALFLRKNGPLLYKGVVQSCN